MRFEEGEEVGEGGARVLLRGVVVALGVAGVAGAVVIRRVRRQGLVAAQEVGRHA